MSAKITESGWNIFLKALQIYLENQGWKCENDFSNHTSYIDNGKKSFFIIPLIYLDYLPKVRQKNNRYNVPVIFLITGDYEWPSLANKKIRSEKLERYFGNPKFGKISQAILKAELLKDKDKDQNLKNVLKVTDDGFEDKLITLLKNNWFFESIPCEYRKKFYDAFVNFYNVDDCDLNETSTLENHYIKDNTITKAFPVPADSLNLDSLLKMSERLYCKLNNIDYDKLTHRVKFEYFRAPIPFYLQELMNARNEIYKNLFGIDCDKGEQIQSTSKPLQLLLIDNKFDKILDKKGKMPLIELINKLGLSRLFKIITLNDNFIINSYQEKAFRFLLNKKPKNKAPDYQPVKNSDIENYSKDAVFVSDEFESALKNLKNNDEKDTDYALKIYNKIKSSNFILLDFFLNEENTYLAFDFIRDIADIKRKQGDVSTTWYFITSAMYDSVVKYSQSGLLAEYYESAVVNAGDDPTNEKRQIIFIYKLLTFIQARLRNFEGFKKAFKQIRLFKEDCGEKTDYCKDLHNCLYPIQSLCRKYLGEYNEIIKIFPSIRNEKKFKENIELTDNIINQFLWLPEADWPMIQRQIEHLNIRLEKEALINPDETEIKFYCKYILEELKKRSEIY